MGELKIYEVKEKDWDNVNARRCASCDHRAIDKDGGGFGFYCDIDKHYIPYIDYDMYWCRRWKRNRKCDGVKQSEGTLGEGKE